MPDHPGVRSQSPPDRPKQMASAANAPASIRNRLRLLVATSSTNSAHPPLRLSSRTQAAAPESVTGRCVRRGARGPTRKMSWSVIAHQRPMSRIPARSVPVWCAGKSVHGIPIGLRESLGREPSAACGTGSDLALDTADVVITPDDQSTLPTLIAILVTWELIADLPLPSGWPDTKVLPSRSARTD